MKSGKVWGWTIPVFAKNNVEINLIGVFKGARCSRHKHDHKHNLFLVISGWLRVCVEKADYDLTDKTEICGDEITSVAPGQHHWFEGVEETVALEIYWVELDPDDIERDGVGSDGKDS